jgi:hypothetical protein
LDVLPLRQRKGDVEKKVLCLIPGFIALSDDAHNIWRWDDTILASVYTVHERRMWWCYDSESGEREAQET